MFSWQGAREDAGATAGNHGDGRAAAQRGRKGPASRHCTRGESSDSPLKAGANQGARRSAAEPHHFCLSVDVLAEKTFAFISGSSFCYEKYIQEGKPTSSEGKIVPAALLPFVGRWFHFIHAIHSIGSCPRWLILHNMLCELMCLYDGRWDCSAGVQYEAHNAVDVSAAVEDPLGSGWPIPEQYISFLKLIAI